MMVYLTLNLGHDLSKICATKEVLTIVTKDRKSGKKQTTFLRFCKRVGTQKISKLALRIILEQKLYKKKKLPSINEMKTFRDLLGIKKSHIKVYRS